MSENKALIEALRELSNVLLSEDTLTGVLERTAFLSVRAIPACEGAGVSAVAGSQVVTIASSEERVRLVDEIQYRSGDGPCLQAIRDGEIFKADSLVGETRWPGFADLATRAGVRACLAIPLLEEGSTFGALNLYSFGDLTFGEDDEKAAVALAAQAAGALSNMRRYEELESIASRLSREASSAVDVALGILMERERCTIEGARAKLRSLAEDLGGSLDAAALSIVRP